jgi:hypothetical protein
MNPLTGIDQITSAEYGFRTLFLGFENQKIAGNELLGIVRIISEPAMEIRPDPLTLRADQILYSTLFEGEIRVVQLNLRDLDDRKIAEAFAKIFKEFHNCVIHGHSHVAKSITVSRLSPTENPLHHDPLLLIFGDCANGVAHSKQPILQQGLNYYERKVSAFEKQEMIDQKRFSVLTTCFNEFHKGISQTRALSSEITARLQTLQNRIARVASASQGAMSVANLGDQMDIVESQMKVPKNPSTQTNANFAQVTGQLNTLFKSVESSGSEAKVRILKNTKSQMDLSEPEAGSHESAQLSAAESVDRLASFEEQLNAIEKRPSVEGISKLTMELSIILKEAGKESNPNDLERIRFLTGRMQELADKMTN